MPRRHVDAVESSRQHDAGEREVEAVLHRLLGQLAFNLCAFGPADSGPHCDQVTVDHGFRSECDNPAEREDVSVDFAGGVELPADERSRSGYPRTRLEALPAPKRKPSPPPAATRRTPGPPPAAAGVGRLEAMARVPSPASRAQIHQ